MGWSSAGPKLFDPIARLLVDTGAEPKRTEDVLAQVIGVLREEDWDTEYDSLAHFADHPAVVRAFARNGVTLTDN
ncbi:hypothetical protein [Streptomyces sp. NRRL S-350]|uniref:hypothetical protein n=1 Tax=Streptomyces sp. NRRL S-350 TaxID=1463902 RepID=UPI0004C24BCA|nr:hypothetical protein [Streptomyces sp. NRRL S-350]